MTQTKVARSSAAVAVSGEIWLQPLEASAASRRRRRDKERARGKRGSVTAAAAAWVLVVL